MSSGFILPDFPTECSEAFSCYRAPHRELDIPVYHPELAESPTPMLIRNAPSMLAAPARPRKLKLGCASKLATPKARKKKPLTTSSASRKRRMSPVKPEDETPKRRATRSAERKTQLTLDSFTSPSSTRDVKYEEGESYATPVLNSETPQGQRDEDDPLDRRRAIREAARQASRKLRELSEGDALMIESDDDFMPL